MTIPVAEEGTLLAAAVQYATRTVGAIRADQLTASTPCEGWNLRSLLLHLDDSLAALHDGIAVGAIALAAGPDDVPLVGDTAEQLIAAIRSRGDRLLCACAAARSARGNVTIADQRMPLALVGAAGAVELAVHGWDVARTGGIDAPIPDPLARELLRVLPAVVDDTTREDLFAPPLAVPASACAGDRLVAFLGRSPRWGDERGTSDRRGGLRPGKIG